MSSSSNSSFVTSNYSNASVVLGTGNNSVESYVYKYCRPSFNEIPRTNEFLHDLPAGGYVLLAILVIFMLGTIAVYVEEVVFIVKTFKITKRRQSTIWILAFCMVYSICGFLAVLVPRSGTLCDLVSNSFFGTCLYQFGQLMVSYLGGPHRIWEIIPSTRMVAMNTPPVCCCCVCLSPQRFEPKLFTRITLQVMQVAIIRPVIMFFAAILWTNQSYSAGSWSLWNGYVYITVINITSSLVAVYGLMLLRGAFRPELEKDFAITGKIASLQLTLICSAIPNVIIGILVSTNVIKCGPIFSSKARGEVIYHGLLVLLMLPFSLMARHFYRRSSDGSRYAVEEEVSTVALHDGTATTVQPSTSIVKTRPINNN